MFFFFFCKQKTAYDMRISDGSSDVGSSDLLVRHLAPCKGLPDAQVFLAYCGPRPAYAGMLQQQARKGAGRGRRNAGCSLCVCHVVSSGLGAAPCGAHAGGMNTGAALDQFMFDIRQQLRYKVGLRPTVTIATFQEHLGYSPCS